MDSTTSRTPPAPSTGPTPTVVAERRGPFAPRVLLLAAIIYHPTVLIGYLLYLYGPSNACVVGTLCGFGSYPPLVQALTLLAGCALLWLAIYMLVYRLITTPDGGSAAALLRNLSAYSLIAPLLRLYGFMIVAGLLLAVLARHLTIPALVVGGFGAFVCFYCAPQRQQAGSGGPS